LVTLLTTIYIEKTLTGKNHAHVHALLEAAVLASVAMDFVDWAVAVAIARVRSFILHRAFEEAFTPVISHRIVPQV
jgi:hypothetical protein